MAASEKASFEEIISVEGAYVDYTNNQVCLANGTAIASLNDLKEATDGTRQGIVDINGTPYEIVVNKEGTLSDLRQIDSQADWTARERNMYIRAHYSNPETSGWSNAVGGGWGHYNGLDNVPYDGYQATLHKGERVLTAEENKVYSSNPGIDYDKMERCMRSAIRDLTMQIGEREFGRIIDNRLRERGILV